MTTEIRSDGLWWSNKNLEIKDAGPYPLNYRFFRDGKEGRCRLNWEGVWDNGKEGWLVGTTVAVTVFRGQPIGADRALVLFENGVSCLSKKRIKRI